MVDKILPNEVYTTTSNNSKDEDEDYRFDAKRNYNPRWGK
jgi:hypothetical protein